MAATGTTCHNRGPNVLNYFLVGNWYRSELEDQLNELNIAFSSKDKVTALIKKLEHARFHPSFWLGNSQLQEAMSSQQRTARKRSSSCRRTAPSVQVVASEESDGDSSDYGNPGMSSCFITPRKRQAPDFQREVAEAVCHCIPEVVQAVVSNIGLQQSQDYHTNSSRVRTANDFISSFPQGDVRPTVPTPLSVSYNMPEEVNRKVLGGKFIHL